MSLKEKIIHSAWVKKVNQLRHLFLAWFFYWRYGRPGRKLIVVGVTGTKGKSTTCRLIASVLEAGGYRVGLMSTVEFQIGDRRWLNDKKMTMLGLGQTQKMLRDMVRAGCQYAVIETSSEGILQYRHFGLNYDVSVFLNLGMEHSERHGGYENLRRDKGKMFAALKKSFVKKSNGKKIAKTIIVNGDDKEAPFFLNFKSDQKYAFCLEERTLRILPSGIKIVKGMRGASGEAGSTFTANGAEYSVCLVGEFNVPNALAAVTVGLQAGLSHEQIALGLSRVKNVEGRMEFIDEGQSFKVIVDYAHEPLSLTALFKALRGLVGEKGQIIALVGSDGGGRDKGKRVAMGEIAGRLADKVFVTDVNCFDEDPKEIAEMLAVGARQAGKVDGKDLWIVVDRKEAARQAILLARAGDVVVLTAKGTEPCMVGPGGSKIPWDDRSVVRKLLLENIF